MITSTFYAALGSSIYHFVTWASHFISVRFTFPGCEEGAQVCRVWGAQHRAQEGCHCLCSPLAKLQGSPSCLLMPKRGPHLSCLSLQEEFLLLP